MTQARQPTSSSTRAAIIGVLTLCAALVLGLLALQGGGPGDAPDQTPSPAATSPARPSSGAANAQPDAAHTPVSGLPTIAESDLPPPAHDTLDLIRDGGPYPHRQDDGTFFNREGILPQQREGYYREYTVQTPGSGDRGARRIVTGRDGDLYYTQDHYDSFEQIMEGQ